MLKTTTDPHSSVADVKKSVLQSAGNVPLATPPGALELRIRADLESLAAKIADSQVTLGQLTAGVQTIVNKLSDTDPIQVNLKRELQSLVPNAQAFGGTVDQLKGSLKTLINNVTDYSAPVLTIKNDLQTLLKNIPGEADSVAVAVDLVRVFANNVWDRYLADIISQLPPGKLQTRCFNRRRAASKTLKAAHAMGTADIGNRTHISPQFGFGLDRLSAIGG
jgi:hypothetical protein